MKMWCSFFLLLNGEVISLKMRHTLDLCSKTFVDSCCLLSEHYYLTKSNQQKGIKKVPNTLDGMSDKNLIDYCL